MRFEGTWSALSEYSPLPGESAFRSACEFHPTKLFQQFRALHNQNIPIQMLNSSGRIVATFHEFKRRPGYNEKYFTFDMKPSQDSQSPFFDAKEKNKLVMNLRLFDEEYEDEHHVITSVVLNLRVDGKVLVMAETPF